jgi:hypothetical protein
LRRKGLEQQISAMCALIHLTLAGLAGAPLTQDKPLDGVDV